MDVHDVFGKLLLVHINVCVRPSLSLCVCSSSVFFVVFPLALDNLVELDELDVILLLFLFVWRSCLKSLTSSSQC